MIDAGLFLGVSSTNNIMHETDTSNTTNMDIMEKLDSLIVTMGTNNTNLNAKVDGIDEKLSELSTNLSKLDDRVKSNEEKVAGLEQTTTRDSIRIANVEEGIQNHTEVLKDVQESCTFLSNSYELLKELPKELAALKHENVLLKKCNDDLTIRLQNEEISGNNGRQYQRDVHNVKLVGIPHQEYEDYSKTKSNPVTLEVVKRVCDAASISFDQRNVDVCHRLGKSSVERPAAILLRFPTKFWRNEFYDQRDNLKTITQRDLDFTGVTEGMDLIARVQRNVAAATPEGKKSYPLRRQSTNHTASAAPSASALDTPIFMAEHLTKRNQDLLKAARSSVKDVTSFPDTSRMGK
jgi:hypothetical protein